MKKYLNKKNIVLIICLLIIIAGAITLALSGFEKSIEYKSGTRIEVYIQNGYKKQDIINIAKESFETDVILFLEIEKLNQVAGIKVTEYTQEQLDTYLKKLSEKYELDEKSIEYDIAVVPETKISTLVEPYILPILFSTTIALIYIIVKNFNKGINLPLRVLKILVITLGIYFSIITIFKIQFSIYTMPFALAIYIISLLIAVNKKCE